MFGLVANDIAYLKADDGNRTDFEERGCGPFKPWEHKKMTMPYFEIPPDVLEDDEELVRWARRSLDIALGGD
jgi:DNA transformation protein